MQGCLKLLNMNGLLVVSDWFKKREECSSWRFLGTTGYMVFLIK
jgi:hypothetical protein